MGFTIFLEVVFFGRFLLSNLFLSIPLIGIIWLLLNILLLGECLIDNFSGKYHLSYKYLYDK